MSNYKKQISNILLGNKIKNIEFSRGLGIIPSKFIIQFVNPCEYCLEIESNFRIISNERIICCFEDLYLTKNKKLITEQKFSRQKHIESTFLSSSLDKANIICSGKKIINCDITSFGDLYIYLENQSFIHAINDNQYIDSIIFRVVDTKNKKTIQCENGKEYQIDNIKFEIKTKNGKVHLIKF
ncbi:MAG: hypothetical protein HUJ59_04430 [Bacilli bacterium]|nr:hypothetical protein [Bacilli bacterium]MCF0124473.1 hypothetical protein [Clostridia bacterium]